MFALFRPKDVEDLQDKLRGKTKRFRLTRNGGALRFTGRLLSLYRRDPETEPACPPVVGCVDTLAVFATRAGRFFVFYVVAHPDGELPEIRQEYAHVCPDLPALRVFLQAMIYVNKASFVDRALAESGWKPDTPPAPEPSPDAVTDPTDTPATTDAAAPAPVEP